ncbi:hypothetical protein BCR33DRAFT_721554 [Rhizoclosmatium globosum]|uniref:F-box domain-containing protein n=1 Tax=Rhizoclosmatium globosum TaxID=329046 RepID=A0A1Y2BR28_9FUNG|nr:hypothetical protein BCR33DRAFT_721554 [Rhizoclosmatium globosum]|eukprot:ORY37193.1 hypothetical protein BCR33DRAFT_721554 [Rhizoclosmatium globosum]
MLLILLPTEILCQVIPYLDPTSLLRFCRAVPRLNEYADTLYKTGIVTKLYKTGFAIRHPPTSIWPNVAINLHSSDSEILIRQTPQGYWDLMHQFGGSTIIESKPHHSFNVVTAKGIQHQHDVSQRCSLVSRKISLRIHYSYQIAYIFSFWAKLMLLHEKDVVSFSYIDLHFQPLGPATSAQMQKSLIDLNPQKMECAAQDTLIDVMPKCTRLRQLSLTYLKHIQTYIAERIAQTKSLKILTLLGSPRETDCLDVIHVLPQTQIQWFSLPQCHFYSQRLMEAGFVKNETKVLDGKTGWWYRSIV